MPTLATLGLVRRFDVRSFKHDSLGGEKLLIARNKLEAILEYSYELYPSTFWIFHTFVKLLRS